jgi:hypothetical protein
VIELGRRRSVHGRFDDGCLSLLLH